MQPIIEVKNLYSQYGETTILKDVSLEVYPNEVLVILGTSGCGKTTLLKNLIGLLKPSKGRVKILDREIITLNENEYSILMQNVGVLFQNGALLNSLPLWENIAIPLEQHTNLTIDLLEPIIRLKLDIVGLSHAYNLLPSELSGGMRKRAALARAIALDPQILFADEPSAGLDPVTSASLDKLLLSLKDQLNMTLVIVTHEVSSIKRIADRVLYLDEGKAIFSGKLEEAMQSDLPALKSFFQTQL